MDILNIIVTNPIAIPNFMLAVAPPPPPAASSGGSSGVAWWLIVVIVLGALVGVALVAAVLILRPKGPSGSSCCPPPPRAGSRGGRRVRNQLLYKEHVAAKELEVKTDLGWDGGGGDGTKFEMGNDLTRTLLCEPRPAGTEMTTEGAAASAAASAAACSPRGQGSSSACCSAGEMREGILAARGTPGQPKRFSAGRKGRVSDSAGAAHGIAAVGRRKSNPQELTEEAQPDATYVSTHL